MTITDTEWQTEPRYALNHSGLIDPSVRRLINDTTTAVRAADGRVRYVQWEDETGVVVAVTEQGRWLIAWDSGARSEETPFTVTALLPA